VAEAYGVFMVIALAPSASLSAVEIIERVPVSVQQLLRQTVPQAMVVGLKASSERAVQRCARMRATSR